MMRPLKKSLTQVLKLEFKYIEAVRLNIRHHHRMHWRS